MLLEHADRSRKTINCESCNWTTTVWLQHHSWMLWQDSFVLLVQVYWRVTEDKQRDCTYKGKNAEVCVKSFKTKDDHWLKVVYSPLTFYLSTCVNHLYENDFFPLFMSLHGILFEVLGSYLCAESPNKGTGRKRMCTALTFWSPRAADSMCSHYMYAVCLCFCGWTNKALTLAFSLLDLVAGGMPQLHSNPAQSEWLYNLCVWYKCV